MNYNDISRRGLIKLGRDYDETSDNALLTFLNQSGKDYEPIRPVEQIVARLDEVGEKFSEKGDAVSEAIMDRVNHAFDSVIESLEDEAKRCEDIGDEQDDDDSYTDEEGD